MCFFLLIFVGCKGETYINETSSISTLERNIRLNSIQYSISQNNYKKGTKLWATELAFLKIQEKLIKVKASAISKIWFTSSSSI